MGNANDFSLGQLLNAAGSRLSADLAERLVPHRGEEGNAREEILRSFLRAWLPRHLDVSSGFIFDVNHRVSAQLDVIIADSTVAPRFEVAGGVRFYPCEAVLAVGQLRTHTDSKSKTWDALCNLKAATDLDRSSRGRAVAARSGDALNHLDNHLDRIFTFLFTIDSALSGERAREVLMDFSLRTRPHQWPNMLFALNRHLVTYCCEDGFCPNPQHAKGFSVV